MGNFITLIFIILICYAVESKKEQKNKEMQEKIRQEINKSKKISENCKENYTENYTENYIENYKNDYTNKVPCIHKEETKYTKNNINKELYQDDPIKNIKDTKSTFENEDEDDAIKYL